MTIAKFKPGENLPQENISQDWSFIKMVEYCILVLNCDTIMIQNVLMIANARMLLGDFATLNTYYAT